MKRLLDTSEVLGSVDHPAGKCEACASAVATYDEGSGKVEIQLDAYLRTVDLRAPERRLSADWLPKGETVHESAGPEEASALARDIFHRWVRKVRQAAPQLHPPGF